MKTRMLFLALGLLYCNGISQDLEPLGWPLIEVYIGTTGLNAGERVHYTLEAVGSVWEGGPFVGTPYILTNNYQFARYPANSGYVGNSTFSSTTKDWLGFSFIPSRWPGVDLFSYGVYKLKVYPRNATLFLDYRDNRYGSYTGCPQCADIWIKYDA
jgi:hypothetical protein